MAAPQKSRDAASSFFDNAVVPSPPFDVEFTEFLGNALMPAFSENLNTSRTDVLLEEAALIKQDRKALTILDLCCGQPLLLEKLIKEISEGKQEAKEYNYIGCDKSAREELFLNMWKRIAEQAQPLNISTACVNADASDDPAVVKNALRQYHDDQFDIIYFANALHEIPPAKIPGLLYMLVELLSDKGSLFVLDPDPAWLLKASHWEGLQDLRHIGIDWEAKAVWLSHDVYKQILKSYGCTVKLQFVNRRSQEFWVLYVQRDVDLDTSRREQLVADAKKMLREAIIRQVQEQQSIIRESRGRLIDEYTRRVGQDQKRLRNKGVEFLCFNTSQSRRIEAIIEFDQL